MNTELPELIGLTITKITGLEKDSEKVTILFTDDSKVEFEHIQDCCESVYLEDFECDENRLVGATIISATVATNQDNPPEYPDSWTWSFYKVETTKGELFMRWLGESNGWYSEEVHIRFTKPDSTSIQLADPYI